MFRKILSALLFCVVFVGCTGSLERERSKLKTERDGLLTERDGLLTERDGLLAKLNLTEIPALERTITEV